MNAKKIAECDRNQFYKIINYRLPNRFLSIGIAVAAISILMMFVRKFGFESDMEWIKDLTRKGLILGMLLMSISRDKEEDEMTVSLRSQSYAVAFVIGVIYALVMPYVEYFVDSLLKPGTEEMKDLGGFQVLIFMLLIQLMFYHNLKKYR